MHFLSVIMARIAFVSDVVSPWVKGGMETTHYFEMKELAKKNEVYCFCMQFETHYLDILENQ